MRASSLPLWHRGRLSLAWLAIAIMFSCGLYGTAQDTLRPTGARFPKPTTMPATLPSIPPDESAAMARVQTAPSPESLAALGKVRARCGYQLLKSARQSKDADALALAIGYAKSATTLAPRDPWCWFVLARAYGENAASPLSLSLSADAVRRALELEPNNSGMRLFLGQVLFQQNLFNSALEQFEAAVNGDSKIISPAVVSAMGMAYMLDTQAARGEKFFSDFLHNVPQADAVRLGLAILLHHQGKDDQARQELKNVQLSPKVTGENRSYAVRLGEMWAKEDKTR